MDCLINGIKPGCKYPPSFREFGLGLSYVSQRAYRVVRSTFENHLPDNSTIRAWYANSNFNSPPGINNPCMGLLEKKAAEKKAMGRELNYNLCMDEMSIRQHVQWCDSNKSMIRYSTFGKDADFKDPNVAKQAIVFALVGVNERFKLPIAYHFISSLNGRTRLIGNIFW